MKDSRISESAFWPIRIGLSLSQGGVLKTITVEKQASKKAYSTQPCYECLSYWGTDRPGPWRLRMVSKSLSKKANITVSPVFTPLERLMNEVSEYLFIYLFIYLFKKKPPLQRVVFNYGYWIPRACQSNKHPYEKAPSIRQSRLRILKLALSKYGFETILLCIGGQRHWGMANKVNLDSGS